MAHHIGLQVLRAKIRGFHAAGLTLASRISRNEKEKKARLWGTKRAVGTYCRYHLVAYGLLRGVPYEKIERCSKQNELDANVLLKVMLDHADWKTKRELTVDSVNKMLVLKNGLRHKQDAAVERPSQAHSDPSQVPVGV